MQDFLGAYLKCMRISRGYTQIELAKKLYIAPCTLSHYESGIRMVPFSTFSLAMKECNYKMKIIDCVSNKDITSKEIEKIALK